VAMMSLLRVRDVMTRQVHTLSAKMPIQEAAAALSGWRVSGAPVLEGKRLAGVVSRSDLHDPRRPREDEIAMLVTDVMTPVVYAVRESDPAVLAARLMIEQHIHRVVALDERGGIAGIVTSMDLVEAIAFGWTSRETRAAAHREEPTMEYVDLRRLETSG
jgi:CBS-domain-containing membrane protein